MGFKRTFDAEDMQDLNVKHARQISYCNKLAKLDEGVPYHRVSLEKSRVVGNNIICISQRGEHDKLKQLCLIVVCLALCVISRRGSE